MVIGVMLFCVGVLSAQDVWQQTNGPYGGNISALAINANGDIFAGTEDDGVFRSTNNGATWPPSTTGLTNPFVRSLAINASGHLFAGTWGDGVFRSMDNGGGWTAINTGLTDLTIQSLAINAGGDIFAGTEGSGVFVLPVSVAPQPCVPPPMGLVAWWPGEGKCVRYLADG